MDGTLTGDDVETAEVLCAAFKEVFTQETGDLPAGSSVAPNGDGGVTLAEDGLFSEAVVADKLSRLKCDKSPGPDGIHPHLLKSCSNSLGKPLSIIFQIHLKLVSCQMIGNLPIYVLSLRKDLGMWLETTDQYLSPRCLVRLWNRSSKVSY